MSESALRLFAGTKWDKPPTCELCGLELEACACEPQTSDEVPEIIPEKQKLRIRKEKRKKGKVVTTISGFQFAHPGQAKMLLKELKDLCGTGGTIEDDALVLQGDLCHRLERPLKDKGFSVKVIG